MKGRLFVFALVAAFGKEHDVFVNCEQVIRKTPAAAEEADDNG